MNFRRLGATNLCIPEIGLGTWPLGGQAKAGDEVIGRGQIDEKRAIATVHAAIESGVTFFDTADIYGLGRSEEILCKAVGDEWENVIVGTKVGKMIGSSGKIELNFSPEHIQKSIEGSLRRLKKDCVDLYQLHNPPPEVFCSDVVVECLENLRTQGKIKFWGVSAATVRDAIKMIQMGYKGSTIQVVFNLLRQEAADVLFPLSKANKIGLIIRVPLEYGVLTGKFTEQTTFPYDDHRRYNLTPRLKDELRHFRSLEFLVNEKIVISMTKAALRFILSFEEVSSVIPGARNPAQVEKNASASMEGPLPKDAIERVRGLFCNNFGVAEVCEATGNSTGG